MPDEGLSPLDLCEWRILSSLNIALEGLEPLRIQGFKYIAKCPKADSNRQVLTDTGF